MFLSLFLKELMYFYDGQTLNSIMNPEFNIFPNRERRLHGVEVAEIVRLLGNGPLLRATLQRHRAPRRVQQAGEQSQQR